MSADTLEYRGLHSCATLAGALAMTCHGEHGDASSDVDAQIKVL